MGKKAEYAIEIVTSGWSGFFNWFTGTCTIISLVLAHLLNDSWQTKWTIAIVAIAFLALFCLKLMRQFFPYYLNANKQLKILRQVDGQGDMLGIKLIEIESCEFVSVRCILRLYSKSSGIEQDICNLEVFSITSERNIVARPLFSSKDHEEQIYKHFMSGESISHLRASTIVKNS